MNNNEIVAMMQKMEVAQQKMARARQFAAIPRERLAALETKPQAIQDKEKQLSETLVGIRKDRSFAARRAKALAPTFKFCGKCGAKVPVKTLFCGKCGASFKKPK